MKMIELKKGLYIVQGERYMVLPRDSREVVTGKAIATRDRSIRGVYYIDYRLTGIVKSIESGNLVLSPVISLSTSAVDFGHVYEVTTELEEAKIPIENIESIVGMESRGNGTD